MPTHHRSNTFFFTSFNMQICSLIEFPLLIVFMTRKNFAFLPAKRNPPTPPPHGRIPVIKICDNYL